jgi:hypothetical protein
MKQELMQDYFQFNPDIVLLKSRIEFLENCLALVLKELPYDKRQIVLQFLKEVKP